MQDEYGQVLEAQSISAGLDYPGVGPEHSHLAAIGRARYETVTDAEVHRRLPAAVAHRGHHPRARAGPRAGLGRRGPRPSWPGQTVLLNLSGRGDKDVAQMMDILGHERRCRRPARSRRTLRGRRDAGRKLLVPYVTGGLGRTGPTSSGPSADAGADAIEIGIPFSDPVMDGPVIQEASRAGARRRRHPAGDPRRAAPTSTPACRWR